MTYDPHAALQAIDSNLLPVFTLSALAFVFNAIYFFEAARLGYKHKTYVFPMWALSFFMIHDISFVLFFDKWFYEYNHVLLKFFWVALVVTTLTEIIFLYQYIKYGHKEISPTISQRFFSCLVLCSLPLSFTVWMIIKSALMDDLYLIAFALTVFWNCPAFTQMIWQRRSRKGQSVLLNIGVVGMQISFNCALLFVDPYFRSPLFIGLMIVTILWTLANIGLLFRFPEYRPENAG